MKCGALIPVLVMLPNVIWMLSPKQSTSASRPVPLALTVIENIGRAAILVLPFFYSLNTHRTYSVHAIILMGLLLAVYYACWIRYFAAGSPARLLGAPFLGIPLPMAVAPTLFLMLSSYLMDSYPMLIASILFGVSHIWVSAISL